VPALPRSRARASRHVLDGGPLAAEAAGWSEGEFVTPADQLITFEKVEVIQRSDLGFRCRVGARVVWVGSLQWQPGSEVDIGGRRLVLRRADAAELGLIDWKPAA